jgi:hypothetical protein
MGIEVKRLRLQDVGNPPNSVRVQQNATQHRFLCLEVLRWNGIGEAFKAWLLIPAISSIARASPFDRFVVV